MKFLGCTFHAMAAENELQRDAARSLDQLSEAVGLSRNACWRRMDLALAIKTPEAA